MTCPTIVTTPFSPSSVNVGGGLMDAVSVSVFPLTVSLSCIATHGRARLATMWSDRVAFKCGAYATLGCAPRYLRGQCRGPHTPTLQRQRPYIRSHRHPATGKSLKQPFPSGPVSLRDSPAIADTSIMPR